MTCEQAMQLTDDELRRHVALFRLLKSAGATPVDDRLHFQGQVADYVLDEVLKSRTDAWNHVLERLKVLGVPA